MDRDSGRLIVIEDGGRLHAGRERQRDVMVCLTDRLFATEPHRAEGNAALPCARPSLRSRQTFNIILHSAPTHTYKERTKSTVETNGSNQSCASYESNIIVSCSVALQI